MHAPTLNLDIFAFINVHNESVDAQEGVNCAKNKNFEQPKIKHETIYTGSAKLLSTSSSPTPRWVPLISGFTNGFI